MSSRRWFRWSLDYLIATSIALGGSGVLAVMCAWSLWTHGSKAWTWALLVIHLLIARFAGEGVLIGRNMPHRLTESAEPHGVMQTQCVAWVYLVLQTIFIIAQ